MTQSTLESDSLAPVSLKGLLEPAEVQRYRTPLVPKLVFDLSLSWLQIGFALGLFAWAPNPLTFALAFGLVAGGQQALLLCAHEFAHYLVVPHDRERNDAIGNWLFAAPAGLPYELFRHRHFKHHRTYSTEDDTKTIYRHDLRNGGLGRLVLRCLSGYEYGHHVWEVFAQRRTESEAAKSPKSGPQLFELLPPLVIAQAAVFTVFIPIGPVYYGLLWLLPLVTLVPLLGALRALMEHQPPAPKDKTDTGFFRGTDGPFVRSVRASWFERLFVCKINFGYHAEHHLYPQVSYQYLPLVRRRFEEQNAYDDVRIEREDTYWSTIHKLTRDEPATFHRAPVGDIPKTDVDQCPACVSSERIRRYPVVEHEYTTTTTDTFPLWACRECGAWYLSPRPDKEALEIIYPPNYYAHVLDAKAQGELGDGKRGLFSTLAAKLFRERFAPIQRYIELTEGIRWLDIGCGNGAVLEWLKESYGIDGTGLDLSEEGVKFCIRRGFEAHVGRFEDWDGKGETFDLIHSAHVIEHVESPLAYMEKAYELLDSGGICAFFTPNTDTWEARFFGRHWGGLHAPRHWTLLDAKSAKALGERAGFEHLETHFSTNGTFWTWTFHSLLRPVLGADFTDWLLPSDHRFIEPNLRNTVRIGLFTAFDLLNVAVFGRSANMLVVFRKP